MAISRSILIEPDMFQLLNDLADGEVRSPEFVVRDALLEYAARHVQSTSTEPHVDDLVWDTHAGPKLTDAEFLTEAETSWQDFQRTGLHVTHEEIGEWIERLRNDPNAKPPECHT